MDQRLHGQVALVTGASSGIGAATAAALAREGAQVALVARRADGLAATARAIQQAGGQAVAIAADLTDEEAARWLPARVVDALGRLDLVVNAAGVGVAAPFQDTLPDEYRPMFEVNVLGPLWITQAAVEIMRAQRAGHIVFVSSGTGRYIHPSTVYSGAKHAVSAIAESLRREVGKLGIRVTSIEPGAVRTAFTHAMRDEVRLAVEARLGDMEQLQAADVANAIVYAVTQPTHVNVNILTLYPTQQA